MHLENTTYCRRKLSLTSLIDVMFLLLLFFMLSSTFSKFGKIEINSASSTGFSKQNKPTILISLSSQDIRVNGRSVALELVKDMITGMPDVDKNIALVKVVEGTSTQNLADLLQALSLVKGLKTSVVK